MSVAGKANIDAYFERIGFAGSIAPSLDTLGQLIGLHVAQIPFENLDPLMGAPVRLELANLQQKLLFDRRGGYCLEHNILLKAMLEELDYQVRIHPAVVLWGREEPVEEPPTHVILTVEIAGSRYLVDAGFGRQTPSAPLRLRSESEQQTPHEPYRLIESEGTWRAEALIGDEWRPLFRTRLEPIDEAGLNQINERVSSSPAFRDRLIAARADKGRRVALLNRRLSIRPTGGTPEIRELATTTELREALSGTLGILLPNDERLEPALEKALAAALD